MKRQYALKEKSNDKKNELVKRMKMNPKEKTRKVC